MKRLCLVAMWLFLPLTLAGTASAQNTQNFVINSFGAQYQLTKDDTNQSHLATNEYIQAQFPNYDQNHGILRALPLSYNGHPIGLSVTAVDNAVNTSTPATSVWNYTSSDQNGNLVLKIGSASSYVQGVQNYHIQYSSKNVTRNSGSYDEFFWNVNGTDWSQPMDAVHATLELSPDLTNSLYADQKPVCFTGVRGSTEQSCSITKTVNANGRAIYVIASNAPLAAGENLSFAVAFKAGTFAPFKASFWSKIQPIIAGLLATGIVLTTLFISIRQWRKYGRDPKGRGTIVPEYQPPKESSLLMHEFVLNENGRPIAITAQLINLAVRGYVRINDTEKDALIGKKHSFSLEQLKDFGDLPSDEKRVVDMLFGDSSTIGTSVELDSLKNKLSAETAEIWKLIASNSVSNGYLVSDPKKAIGTYVGFGIGAIVFGFAGFFVGGIIGVAVGIACIVSGILLCIVARYMPARTPKGVELHDYLLGLKLYINTAEKDRIAFHQGVDTAERTAINQNDPAQKIKLFEQLLPYAMLFGLEKDWGKQFADIYTAPPAWYGGSMNNFTTGYLLGSLGDFNSAAATSFSAPPSSGGSGFSGGSSGGGGGGGGGGGW